MLVLLWNSLVFMKIRFLNSKEDLQNLFTELQNKEQELLQHIEQLDFKDHTAAKRLYILLNYVYKIQQQLQTKKRLMG